MILVKGTNKILFNTCLRISRWCMVESSQQREASRGAVHSCYRHYFQSRGSPTVESPLGCAIPPSPPSHSTHPIRSTCIERFPSCSIACSPLSTVSMSSSWRPLRRQPHQRAYRCGFVNSSYSSRSFPIARKLASNLNLIFGELQRVQGFRRRTLM